jgi:hypothetical protein
MLLLGRIQITATLEVDDGLVAIAEALPSLRTSALAYDPVKLHDFSDKIMGLNRLSRV